ncbi:SDR family NAD(P)-dependent oxidoreductase [Aspergillus saccharolyticus JOP 1030-1]|uniref:Short chain dehydrogenase/reductase n=1 Tax=Aspergillus saccharolyticus JOP 1030-1 TaxID=1450539 RepID=A0A318Z6V3_9EURO|nr:short chain dehydrogenase/reductase [Aspergillus saccharolyticus JOP 1030-1]PYH43041.1 short chain dehydrogenase/reductase [Aspergillus saccharolyticus JOP 1030-1]
MTTPTVFRPGATALITGAASGIGLAAAHYCHREGMNVILLDIDATKLTAAAAELEQANPASPKPHTFVLDVSKQEDWAQLQPTIHGLYPQGIDLLMLNAGRLATPASDKKTPWHDPGYFESTFATNTFGYTNGLATFLDSVTGTDTATTTTENPPPSRAIILTGSKQGITNPPGNPAYNASKSAVKTIAEHLAFDLHRSYPQVSVHLLVPGWVYTGMMRKYFATKPDGCWTPQETVEFLVRKMAAGSFYIICPDNEVTEELDRKRIAWACGDLVRDRPALSRWREDWKERAAKGIEGLDVGLLG